MSMFLGRLLLATVGSVLVAAGPVLAESVFGSAGLGRWNTVMDARAAGLGDVSIVSPSRWSFSPRNPALAAVLPAAGVHASVATDFTTVKAGSESDRRVDGRLMLIRGVTPLLGGFVGAVGVSELSDGRFEIAQSVESAVAPYTLHTKGRGGWTQLDLSLTRRFRGVAVGVGAALPFGSLRDEISREFEDAEFENREETIETALEGAVFLTFGSHVRRGRVSAGGFVQLPADADLVTTRSWVGGRSESTSTLEIPAAYGFGTALSLSSHLAAVAEVRRQQWGSAKLDPPGNSLARTFTDSEGWGVGLQWSGRGERKDSGFSKIEWRVGYGYAPWNTEGPSSGRIVDRTITAGMGLPFRDDSGMIDIAVRYTSRREEGSDLEENAVGILFGFSLSRQERPY